MNEEIISVSGMSFCYPSRRDAKVFDNASLCIRRGETVGIIGANGTGKSTLLRLLSGLETPGAGEIVIDGLRLEKKNLKNIRKKLAYVFQDSQNQLFMTKVRDELEFAPDNYGFDSEKKARAVNEAVEATGISYLLERYVYQLSGGERKLVALSSVLTACPEIILMDEPTAALDPLNRRRLIGIINGLEGTKLITSHDLDMIWDTCTRVILLNGGMISADGKAREILSDEALLAANYLELPLRLQGIGR